MPSYISYPYNWLQLSLKERYPFKEDHAIDQVKWTSAEGHIQYLRELAGKASTIALNTPTPPP